MSPGNSVLHARLHRACVKRASINQVQPLSTASNRPVQIRPMQGVTRGL